MVFPSILTSILDTRSLMRSSNLRLFGRLRPDRHVQRVETPAANRLFTQLDARLRSHRITLSTLAAPFCKAQTVGPDSKQIQGCSQSALGF
jgi:hypothetical protein